MTVFLPANGPVGLDEAPPLAGGPARDGDGIDPRLAPRPEPEPR